MPRRRKDAWDDAFELFDQELAEMRAHMDRVLERMFSGELGQADDPLVYGFSMRLAPGQGPVVQEVGGARPARADEAPPAREPLTDILESGDQVRVIMELPGVDREDIKVSAYDRCLDLEVRDQRRRPAKHLDLPCEVVPDSARASYKNGVLEVVMQRRAPKRKGKSVRVE
jgi:HSP20 family protein